MLVRNFKKTNYTTGVFVEYNTRSEAHFRFLFPLHLFIFVHS